jgi:hypothetical protein
VRYHGLLRKADQEMYLLSDCFHGGTLGDFVRKYGYCPVPLVRTMARHLVRGLDQIYRGQGLATVFLDTEHVWVDAGGVPRIEAPPVDVTVAAQRLFPHALLTLPVLVIGKGDLQKADVWLLGIALVKMLSGNPDLVADYASATAVGAQLLARHKTLSSTLELFASWEQRGKVGE